MRTIYKYPLQVFGFDYGEVDVPEGEVLSVAFQNGVAYAWIDQDKDEIRRMRLRLIGTGHEYDPDTEDLLYQGSAISDSFCWHVYRVYE